MLWVQEMDSAEALRAISQYRDENEEHLSSSGDHVVPFQKNWSGLWVSVGLVSLHMFFRIGSGVENLFRTYGSSAFLILHGDYYRAVTSLMLHGSAVHLLGNAVGLALFGSAVCSLNGTGFGWLMILTAGTAGNLFNALFYRTGHFSVGSSTAVFGALGILVAQQCLRIIRGKHTGLMKAWVPIAGGLALLGLLGTGERADLTAHFFGFLAGIPLGLLGSNLPERLNSVRFHYACGVATGAIVLFSWFVPIMGG